MNDSAMTIVFNGQPCEMAIGSTVADVLRRYDLLEKPVAVELNLEVVPRARRQERILRHGDRLEVVSLIGGG